MLNGSRAASDTLASCVVLSGAHVCIGDLFAGSVTLCRCDVCVLRDVVEAALRRSGAAIFLLREDRKSGKRNIPSWIIFREEGGFLFLYLCLHMIVSYKVWYANIGV